MGAAVWLWGVGFPCCRARPLEHRLSGCGTWVSCPAARGISLVQGSNRCLPELASEFLPLDGKSFNQVLFRMTGLCRAPAVGRAHLGGQSVPKRPGDTGRNRLSSCLGVSGPGFSVCWPNRDSLPHLLLILMATSKALRSSAIKAKAAEFHLTRCLPRKRLPRWC